LIHNTIIPFPVLAGTFPFHENRDRATEMSVTTLINP